MPALLFNKCCGCVELRTGCLIIGYLQLVGEIIVILLALLALVSGSAKKELGVVVAVLLLVLGLLLVFTITLLVGLHKRKRGHVKAYLVYAAIFSVVSTVAMGIFFVKFAGLVSTGDIVKNIVTTLLNVYYLLVVRSYYYELRAEPPAAAYRAVAPPTY